MIIYKWDILVAKTSLEESIEFRSDFSGFPPRISTGMP